MCACGLADLNACGLADLVCVDDEPIEHAIFSEQFRLSEHLGSRPHGMESKRSLSLDVQFVHYPVAIMSVLITKSLLSISSLDALVLLYFRPMITLPLSMLTRSD